MLRTHLLVVLGNRGIVAAETSEFTSKLNFLISFYLNRNLLSFSALLATSDPSWERKDVSQRWGEAAGLVLFQSSEDHVSWSFVLHLQTARGEPEHSVVILNQSLLGPILEFISMHDSHQHQSCCLEHHK